MLIYGVLRRHLGEVFRGAVARMPNRCRALTGWPCVYVLKRASQLFDIPCGGAFERQERHFDNAAFWGAAFSA